MPMHAVTYVYADRPAELDAVRPEHRAFLRALAEAGTVVASGPLAGTADAPAGALLLVDAASPEAVEETLDADPFAHAGLIAAREVRAWSPVIGVLADRV